MIQDIGFLICLVLLIGFGTAIPWAVRNDNAGELYEYDHYTATTSTEQEAA